MLHTLKLPRIDAVGQRLQLLGDELLVQLDGHQWHTDIHACHAVCPTLQLDYNAASSAQLWRQWREHASRMPTLPVNADIKGPLPGWYGYLGYDAGRPTLRALHGALPVATLGFYPCIVVECTAHVEIRCLDGYEALAQKIATALQKNTPTTAFFRLVTPFTADTSEAHYREGFARIIDYIHAGDCYQVNYAHRFSGRFTGHPYIAYEAIRQTMNSPYSGYVRHADGCVLSFSPEQFVSLCDGLMKTSPIKGTRPRSTDPANDLQQRQLLARSEKDRAENVMIVDLLRNDLSRVAEIGSVSVPDLFHIQSFTHVHHMISTVTARLKKGGNAIDVLEACFPGGSITGAPKRRACEIIAELETFPRSAYCGSLFYLDVAGNMQSNILIRTVVAEGNEVFCWGGGGIVADSNCQLEYEETLHKVGRLMQLFEGTFEG